MTEVALLDSVVTFLSKPLGSFIDGAAVVDGQAGAIDIINPATEQVIARVQQASASQVDAAVAAASRAFQGSWAQTSPYLRGVLLNKLADAIEAHGEELAQLEALNSGKAINVARGLEVAQSVIFLRYFAGWTTKINGESITPSLPSMAGEHYTAFTRREPVGVVAGIVPWNFPLLIAVWKLGSALATGCTIVLKPSEFSPLSLLRLVELAKEVGLPNGAINVVTGAGQVGQQLTEHAAVRKVSFTGSVPTGIAVGAAAMKSKLTRVTLELGGKNPAALLADVNIDEIIPGLLMTAFTHQGQICASPERIYVHRSRIDELSEKLGAALASLKIGSPLDESVQFGPLANKAHYDKIVGYFARMGEGNQVVTGGKTVGGKGYFVQPTLLRTTTPDDLFLTEETFGPIVCLMPFDTDEELLELLNDTPYGLGASLWTNDLSKALRMIPRIESGTVWVNMHTFLDPAVPFGGSKSSGIGREFGSAFIEAFTELKSVMIRY
ncbi:NAD-dependent phenylacetaldehyde dehydrogenase [Pseudomonas alkylphenolica]|uniref:NAD-dependent phenylacetaldehyde dehydrogenase n=1 Tax=Pseudomonas alkylphenolica TaxID=237609 RepID=A0A443ZJG6_9PSED|nr:aldehyde dehydrogenase family protein [Pseudomonas alkylphenolica]RWU18986.1 NAD-dependent phenylacetaldehyde dehydrogenase [Pseudomonas alkylphenolica]